jgi:tetratricopeptide (TPR) repeat protein
MKAAIFIFLGILFLTAPLSAQTNAVTNQPPVSTPPVEEPTEAPTAAAENLTPAQVADYQRRFEQGYDLEKQGKLAESRAVYDGILAEQADAKRSLLEAGRVSLEMNDPLKADAYLDRLHAIVPYFPDAFELLIQANQALRHDVKTERLVREYRALRDSGKVPGFSDTLFFDREHIRLDAGSEIIISQYFDYTQPPYHALEAELFDAQHQVQRVLLLNYDPDGTQTVRAKDPKLARDEVFIVAEPFYTGNQMTRIDVYQELLSAPDYNKARTMLLRIFTLTPKAIYSAPVSAATQ